MQVYSDRFETTLPREARFTPPKTKQQKPAFPAFLGYLLAGALIGALAISLTRHEPARVIQPYSCS
jgi:hypothetical protein